MSTDTPTKSPVVTLTLTRAQAEALVEAAKFPTTAWVVKRENYLTLMSARGILQAGLDGKLNR